MAFINEYVSEEDIKKYGLVESKLRYNPHLRASGFSSSFRFMWVIDRERDIFLMRMKVGREELSNRSIWLLSWKGKDIKVELDRAEGGSHRLNEIPYIKILDLVSVTPMEFNNVSHEVVIQVLKEALEVYGYEGARRQLPNTIVKFNF